MRLDAVNIAPAALEAWERGDFIAACALRHVAAIAFVAAWLREAGLKAVRADFRHAARIAAHDLEHSNEGLENARRVISYACAPWFGGCS